MQCTKTLEKISKEIHHGKQINPGDDKELIQ